MSLPRRFAIALVLAVMASGCEKKISAVCEEKCGSSAQACADSNQKSEDTAEERGCESEFEAWASCADAHATCTNGVLDTKTACAKEEADLHACVE